MRYWVYINDKVDGPYDENKLETLNGFSKDTLICSEEVASSGGQDWVKASSVFEFDEVPVQEDVINTSVATPADTPTSAANATDTAFLLSKLDSLTAEITHLHQKLDSMQTHLDNALEQNKQLAEQIASQTSMDNLSVTPQEQITPAEVQDQSNAPLEEKNPAEETPEFFPEQAAPKEEELIIRSALDSIYGEKVIEQPTQTEEAFQDLLPQKEAEKEAEKVEEIEKELTFTPVEEKQEEEQPTLKEALITTPSEEDIARDELITELTASPKEDVLDQIIREHQEQETQTEQTPDTPETKQADNNDSAWLTAAAAAAGTAAVAGLAANAFAQEKAEEIPSLDDNLPEQPTPQTEPAPAQEELVLDQASPIFLATDRTDPSHMEEVLPADQMPEDAPAAELSQLQDSMHLDALPSLDEASLPSDLPTDSITEPAEDTIEELVPGVKLENKKAQEEEDGIYIKEEMFEQPVEEKPAEQPAEEQPAAEETPVEQPIVVEPVVEEQPAAEEAPVEQSAEEQPAAEEKPAEEEPVEQPIVVEPAVEEKPAEEHAFGSLTDKDLEEAFGPQEQEQEQEEIVVSPAEFEIPENSNPNDLTEIELKEGSTYLISDFVPPAQVAGESNVQTEPNEEQDINKLQETIIQDMLTVASKNGKTQDLPTDGLPDDAEAARVALENTIQAKRGASLDIKTVPMVPEPADSERLNMDDLDDVNAQHDIKTHKPGGKLTKAVIGTLVGLLVFIILYVVLGMMQLLPNAVNVFAKAQPAAATDVTEEFFQEEQPAPLTQEEQSATEQETDSSDTTAAVLDKVQNFPLPNGFTLKEFIESKYAGIDADLITWEIADAVEPDNYSVTVKVPPENPQNFKTVYRFNYNMQTGLLDPTISDSKNLLDQAYGTQN